MTSSAIFAVPGSLDTPTGGYAYDRRVIEELKRLGWGIDVVDLGERFPNPEPASLRKAVDLLLRQTGSHPVIVDGLALGVLPAAARALQEQRPLVALVHHPLALETGVAPERAALLRASEQEALSCASWTIATSANTAAILVSDYGVGPERISVARPGTDRIVRAQGSRDGCVRLLAVGSLVPRKGYDTLLDALALLPRLNWRLTIVGDPGRSPETARALVVQIRDLGLGDRVNLAGAISDHDLMERYRAADLFVLASRFEGYGMAYAEALACGLPIIGTHAGAVAATVPPGTGVLVPPDDALALSQALRQAISDPDLRQQWAAAAWAASAMLPSWPDAADVFTNVLQKVTDERLHA